MTIVTTSTITAMSTTVTKITTTATTITARLPQPTPATNGHISRLQNGPVYRTLSPHQVFKLLRKYQISPPAWQAISCQHVFSDVAYFHSRLVITKNLKNFYFFKIKRHFSSVIILEKKAKFKKVQWPYYVLLVVQIALKLTTKKIAAGIFNKEFSRNFAIAKKCIFLSIHRKMNL